MRLPSETIVQTCLDPVALQPWLQQSLPGCDSGACTIEDLQLTQARRSSSRRRQPHPLTFCVEVALRDHASGQAQRQRFYGKVFRDGASGDALQRPAAPDETPAASAGLAAVQGPLHLPQLDLLLWAFPADPGLPQLPALLDPAQTRPWWGQPACAVHTLRHEPERRATLRYTASDGRELYAKTFRDDRAAALHQRFSHFWAKAQADAQAPTVAQPLGYREDTRSLWQAAAKGQPLLQALVQRANGLESPAARGPSGARSERVAQALAVLHGAPVALAGPTPRDRAHWLQELRRRRNKIGRAVPALAARAEQLADVLQAASDALPEPPLSLIHGDCHPDQIWLQDERPVLFDFDEFCLGDPMEDLAGFIVKLPPTPGGLALAAALPQAYAQHAPAQFHADRLNWHRALQQLLQASRAFVFQLPGWQAELERRLARAEAVALELRTVS